MAVRRRPLTEVQRRHHRPAGQEGRDSGAIPAGVKVEEITVGTGVPAERGSVVTVHYRGFLHRGDPCRSSYDEGGPLRVHLGRREVIMGLERGSMGMRIGGRQRLVISPHLAYGAAGVPGVIPPNALVIVEVE